MSKRGKIKITTKTKLITASVITLVLIITGVVLWKQQQNTLTADIAKEPYSTVSVTEGSIASSTLLSGTVKALSEEYIYFDANKGNDATVTVKVGDQVTQGQQLVQYNTTTAQSAYDTAVRVLTRLADKLIILKHTEFLLLVQKLIKMKLPVKRRQQQFNHQLSKMLIINSSCKI